MKKHAFLILVHEQPSQVALLVESLIATSSGIFVHVDRKSPCDFSNLHQEATVISTQSVRWGGFGMVQATLDLLECASENHDFETYTLLSGADFPIKPLSNILAWLDDTSKNRIDYWHDEDPSWHNRYQRYFFNDVPGLAGRILNAISRRLANVLPKRKFYVGLKPYFGSQWWTLTRNGVQAIFSFREENPNFANYCKTVHVPDELYFQTILLNALGEKEVIREPLRFLDWSDRRANPKILDESDLQALKASSAIFARKFDQKFSRKLISLLENDLVQGGD